MRIRTLAEAESPAFKYSKPIRLASGLVIIAIGVVATFFQYAIIMQAALNRLGHSTSESITAAALSTLGVVTFLGWFTKKLDKLIDENIVGRVRITYIRVTSDHETRLEAISAADDEVTAIMKTINKKRSGSTMESRTNDVSKGKRGYRVTTYATVLVAGSPISNEDILRDGSPTPCTEENRVGQKCLTYTRNASGLCDEHQQWRP